MEDITPVNLELDVEPRNDEVSELKFLPLYLLHYLPLSCPRQLRTELVCFD